MCIGRYSYCWCWLLDILRKFAADETTQEAGEGYTSYICKVDGPPEVEESEVHMDKWMMNGDKKVNECTPDD